MNTNLISEIQRFVYGLDFDQITQNLIKYSENFRSKQDFGKKDKRSDDKRSDDKSQQKWREYQNSNEWSDFSGDKHRKNKLYPDLDHF